MPSQADIDQHRTDLQLLTAAAVAEATRVAASVAHDPVDQMEAILVAAIPLLLQKYLSAAAELATVFYRQSGPGGPISTSTGPPTLAATVPEGRASGNPLPETSRLTTSSATPTVQRLTPSQPSLLGRGDSPTLVVGATDRRAIAAAESFQPRPADPPPHAQIESSVRWSVRAAREPDSEATVSSRLAGTVQRHVANAARDTITENAAREGTKWYRLAQPDACAFCRLLAIRGPDYLSEESAVRVVGQRSKARARAGELMGKPRGTRAIGEKYHDDCRCEPIAVRPGDTYEAPDYMHDWTEQYLKAAANSHGTTKSILAEMRKLSPDSKK